MSSDILGHIVLLDLRARCTLALFLLALIVALGGGWGIHFQNPAQDSGDELVETLYAYILGILLTRIT